VWEEGRQDVDPNAVLQNIKQIRTPLPLMWKWKNKIYLGACHGVAGILHTLLDFQDVLISVDRNAMKFIEETTVLLRENMCTESGNLASSIKASGSSKKSDALVQWCHGAPGHVLLLTQMARKTQNQAHLEAAEDLAASVIQPRGLLRKGVGLCHGIGGNAFCFMSLANAKRELQGDHHASSKWINASYAYANFALDHFDELKSIPDRPFSLYEGMTGLSSLLLALIEGGGGPNSKFPLYEV
jgi:lantibiotic modifying enzyme